MRLGDPFWLWFLPLAPLIGYLSAMGWRFAHRSVSNFLSPASIKRLADPKRNQLRSARLFLLSIVVALLIIAMARPQYGVKPVQITRSGIDIMILVDTSKSMAARDITPNRYQRATIEIDKVLSALAGNRFGLIAFAGESFIECPLTLDTSTLRMFLDTLGPGAIPKPGTDIGGAVEKAVHALKKSKSKTKAIILVTDGEDLSNSIDGAVNAAVDSSIKIFGFGVGTKLGAPAPELSDDGKVVGYIKDERGETVITRLDIASLKKLAEATGGKTYFSTGESFDIDGLVDQLSKLEKTDIASMEYTEYEERYHIPLGMALLLLVSDYFLLPLLSRREVIKSAV